MPATMKPNNKFDILILLDNPFKDAADPRLCRTIQCLQKEGFSVALICYKNNSLPSYEEIDGMKIFRCIPDKIFNIWSFYSSRTKIALSIRKSFSFNILLANDHTMLNIASRIKKKSKNKILVYDVHEFLQGYQLEFNHNDSIWIKLKSIIWRRFQQKIELRDVKLADYIVATNQSFAAIFNYIFKPQTPVFVVRNIPDFESYHKTPLQQYDEKIYNQLEQVKGFNNMIYFGDYFQKLNGFETVLDALKEFPDNVFLILVGNDKSNGFFDNRIRELGLSNKIIRIPRLPQKHLPEIATYVKVAIVPTMECGYLQCYYSLPNKFMDSIKLKLPIICSNLPEHKAIINQYNNGVLTNEIDWEKAPKEIAKAYSKIINNYEFFLDNANRTETHFSAEKEYIPLINILKKSQ